MAEKLSIGSAWTEAAAFVRKERRLLTPVVLALMVVPAVIAELVKPDAAVGIQPEPGAWMLIALMAILIGMVGQLAIMRLAMGWDGSVGTALRLALRRIWSAFGALFLFGMLLSLITIPLIIVVLVISGGDGSDAATSNRLALWFVALVLLAVPRVLPATAVAVEEQLGPWRLLRRTFGLTRGHYWRLLGFFLLFLFASFLLAYATTSAVGSLATLVIGPPEPMSLSRLIIALTVGLVQGAVMAIYAAMTGRITAQLEGSTSGT